MSVGDGVHLDGSMFVMSLCQCMVAFGKSISIHIHLKGSHVSD